MSSVAEPSTSTALDDYVSSRGGNLPIRKILIANNGMAATKSILSMRQWAYMELGDEKAIQFVAMACDGFSCHSGHGVINSTRFGP